MLTYKLCGHICKNELSGYKRTFIFTYLHFQFDSMDVSDAMTPNPISCSTEKPLSHVSELMIKHDIGSVIIHRNETPTGIVTKTDIVCAVYEEERPISNISIDVAMTTPLITIEKTRGIQTAIKLMNDESVKKLVVVDELDVIGIVTMEDIVSNYNRVKSAAFELAKMEFENTESENRQF